MHYGPAIIVQWLFSEWIVLLLWGWISQAHSTEKMKQLTVGIIRIYLTAPMLHMPSVMHCAEKRWKETVCLNAIKHTNQKFNIYFLKFVPYYRDFSKYECYLNQIWWNKKSKFILKALQQRVVEIDRFMFRLDTIPNGLALPVDLTLEELILKIKDTN